MCCRRDDTRQHSCPPARPPIRRQSQDVTAIGESRASGTMIWSSEWKGIGVAKRVSRRSWVWDPVLTYPDLFWPVVRGWWGVLSLDGGGREGVRAMVPWSLSGSWRRHDGGRSRRAEAGLGTTPGSAVLALSPEEYLKSPRGAWGPCTTGSVRRPSHVRSPIDVEVPDGRVR